MMARLAVVLLWLVAFASHAETIPATETSGSKYVIGNITDGTSFADACNRFVSANGYTFFELNVYATYAQCRFLQNGSLNAQNVTISTTSNYVCPSGQGWVLSGTSCNRPDCPGGEFHDPTQGGECKKDCSGKQGMATASGQYSTNVDSWTGTVAGCQVQCSQLSMLVVSTTKTAIMKKCTYTGKTAQSGDSNLEAEAAPNPNEPPKSIKGCAGAGMGYVQSSTGVVTCVAASDAPEGQKPVTKEKAGSVSGTDGNGDGKADPTSPDYKKTDTETSKDGDNVTKKKTETVAGIVGTDGTVTCPSGYSKNADNTCSKTTVSTQTTASFCEENPNSSQCKAETDECKENPDRVGCKTIGDVGEEGAVESKSIGLNSITAVSLGGSNSCPAGATFPRGLGQYDWDPICTWAGALKPLVLALAWLSAAFIVFGFKGE